MQILILGHKGMLGTALMQRLGPFHAVVGKDVEDFDLTSPDSCRELIAAEKPEVVINAAAYTNVDGAESDAERCFAVNAAGVQNITAACRGRGIRIVHFSTDYVFDGTAAAPYREEDPPAPRGVYAASKAAGEKYLQEGSDDYLLIRTAWLYGPVGKNFVKTILEKALPHVPFDGWTITALSAGARDAGLDAARAELAFPGGPIEAVRLFSAMLDRRMLAALDADALKAMKKIGRASCRERV